MNKSLMDTQLILREYVYPDCIKYYYEGNLIGIANTHWVDNILLEALSCEGFRIEKYEPTYGKDLLT